MPQPLHHLFETTLDVNHAASARAARLPPPAAGHFEHRLSRMAGDPAIDGASRRSNQTPSKGIREYLAHPVPAHRPPVFTDEKYAHRYQRKADPGTPRINCSPQVAEAIRAASRTFQVPERLIHAVVKAESAYNPFARSKAGAVGLMQLMPATARDMGVRDVRDVTQNVAGGTRYLREMLDAHHGNVPMALAAYNAGPGAVKRYGGIPPYRETREYVSRVMKYFHSPANTV